jgi:hypothetical protein
MKNYFFLISVVIILLDAQLKALPCGDLARPKLLKGDLTFLSLS